MSRAKMWLLSCDEWTFFYFLWIVRGKSHEIEQRKGDEELKVTSILNFVLSFLVKHL